MTNYSSNMTHSVNRLSRGLVLTSILVLNLSNVKGKIGKLI